MHGNCEAEVLSYQQSINRQMQINESLLNSNFNGKSALGNKGIEIRNEETSGKFERHD